MQSEWHTMNWLSGSILWDFPLNHWADYIEKIWFAVWQNPQGNSHQHSKSIQWLSSIHCKSLFILIHFILHLKPRLNPNVFTSLSLCHPEFVLCFIYLYLLFLVKITNIYLALYLHLILSLGLVIFLMILKEVSCAQQVCIYLIEKIYKNKNTVKLNFTIVTLQYKITCLF